MSDGNRGRGWHWMPAAAALMCGGSQLEEDVMEASTASTAKLPPAIPTVAIVNDASSGVSDADAATMTAAIQKQVTEHFQLYWHTTAQLVVVGQGKKPPAGAWCVALLANSDQAGALGYHDLTPSGLPLGKVFAATDRQYGEQVSVTLSHEVLEMLGDPWINLTAQSDAGKFYAWEACDAVEADSLGYAIDGVPVSAFVTPHWFGHGAGQLSFPSVAGVTRPLQLASGGYISVFDPASGKGWTQLESEEIQAKRQAMVAGDVAQLAHGVPRVGSRRERRFRGSARWVPSTYGQA